MTRYGIGRDQNDRKVDIKYPPPKFDDANLGHQKPPQKLRYQKFPNSLIHPEFNSKGIGRIRYLLTRARS